MLLTHYAPPKLSADGQNTKNNEEIYNRSAQQEQCASGVRAVKLDQAEDFTAYHNQGIVLANAIEDPIGFRER